MCMSSFLYLSKRAWEGLELAISSTVKVEVRKHLHVQTLAHRFILIKVDFEEQYIGILHRRFAKLKRLWTKHKTSFTHLRITKLMSHKGNFGTKPLGTMLCKKHTKFHKTLQWLVFPPLRSKPSRTLRWNECRPCSVQHSSPTISVAPSRPQSHLPKPQTHIEHLYYSQNRHYLTWTYPKDQPFLT